MLISDCMHTRLLASLLNTHIPTLCPGLPPQRASMAQNLRCCAGLDQRPPFDVQFSVRSRARAPRSVLLRFSRRQTVLSLLPGPSLLKYIFTFFLFCDADIPDICDADLRNIHSVSFSVIQRNFSCWPASYDVRSTLRGTCQPCVSENATGW